MSKITRKTIVILLILNLICASINPAIFGLISHAEEGDGGVVTNETTTASIKLKDIGVELGINNTNWSTTQVNDVNFTITMDNQNEDYQDPKFKIILPKEVENVEIKNATDLYNDSNNFIMMQTEIISEKINGIECKGILVSYEGEILSDPLQSNIEIQINTRIKTVSLIPNTEGDISFECENSGASDVATSQIDIVAKKGLIVGLIATDEKGSVIAMDKETKTMQTTADEISLIGKIINNTQEDISVRVKLEFSVENIENNVFDVEIKSGEIYEISGKTTIDENYNLLEDKSGLFVSYYNENDALVGNFAYVMFDKIDKTFSNEKISANIEVNETDKNLYLGEFLDGTITIENKSTTEKMYIDLVLNLPLGVIANMNSFYTEKREEVEGKEQITYETIGFRVDEKNIKLNQRILEPGETSVILTSLSYETYEVETGKIRVALNYTNQEEQIQEKAYIVSDDITFKAPSDVIVKISSDKDDKENLQIGEEIEYKVSIENNTGKPVRVNAELLGIENLKIYSIKIEDVNGNRIKQLIAPDLTEKIKKEDSDTKEAIAKFERIDIEGIVYVVITAKVKENPTSDPIAVKAKITGKQINAQTVNATEKIIEGIQDNGTSYVMRRNVISGSAWIDENGNGAIDNNEALLKDVQAILVNSATSEIVGTARTDNNGQYEFIEVEEGNYVVKFNYNAKTFKTTSYKNEAVAEEANSDAITTVQNNTATTKTDIIKVSNGTEENANIGLVLNKTFDMAINSGINKVTVDNEQGSNTYDFNNINLAKVEIEGEYFKDSLVLVEYEVALTNLGDTEGYATKISSKIPEGMEFIAELNPDWYVGENGKLYSAALANEKLAQGGTKIIKLVLAREMTEGIIQSPVNIVEIEETFNDYLIKDNKTENDKSEATIIISLTTGNVQKYLWLAVLVIAIITIGLFGTRKIVKIDINNLTKQGKE